MATSSLKIIFSIFSILPLLVFSQNNFSVYGYVEDSLSGEKLPGASILIESNRNGTTTNNSGFFTISSPQKTIRLLISHAGYMPGSCDLHLDGNKQVVIKLLVDTKMEEVIVKTYPRAGVGNDAYSGQISLSPQVIKKLPRFLGEPDVLKALQLFPGVTRGIEISSDILVRGGGPEQNLILLDGTQIYNPSHFLGIFSTFNSNALKNVEVYKGGFPARFGGRLSSVVDLVMKDGNMKEFHGEGNIGFLLSNITLEGPLKKDKTSFLFSARRTYPDLIAGAVLKLSSDKLQNFSTYFYDVNAKLHHIFSPKDRIFASFFSGQDVFHVANKSETDTSILFNSTKIKWGNTIGTLQWDHVFSNRLFAHTLLNYTAYKFRSDLGYQDQVKDLNTEARANYFSGINDVGIRTDFDYRPTPGHDVKFGYAAIFHQFRPSSLTLRAGETKAPHVDSIYNAQIQRSPELSVYAEDSWSFSNKLRINAGIHVSAFAPETKWYSSVQPRIGLRYILPINIVLKASYNKMAQYIHFLTNNATTLPTDLWVPSTDKVKPMLSEQWAIGLTKTMYNEKIEISLEGYLKKMNGVIEYLDGAGYLNSAIEKWDNKVEAGKGKSMGMELLLKKEFGKTTGWVGYTLSKSTRKFPTINSGKEFYFKFDRRHTFVIVALHQFNKNLEVSASWQFQTGTPFTLPTAQYESTNGQSPFEIPYEFPYNLLFNYQSRNTFRLLNYHRLDTGITWKKQKKYGEQSWNLGAYNVYNRKNPFYYYLDSEFKNNRGLKGVSILPFVPSISYRIKF